MSEILQSDRARLLDAILTHVVFDGWTEEAFRMAARDCDLNLTQARAACPRGALDLAVDCHRAGDARMIDALGAEDLAEMRFRDRVARAVQLRLIAAGDKDVVRRASSLFALPVHAPEGGKLIWDTADAIWTALGDSSDDLNWYSKRAILSGVYSSTVLYWLGDDSPEHASTWQFLDRRIENVMQFEKIKAQMRKNPLTRPFMGGVDRLFSAVRAPGSGRRPDLPGSWTIPVQETK